MSVDISLVEEYRNAKARDKSFYRLHITKEGKKTTVSIDTFSYELLCIRLEAIPHTKEARKRVIQWIMDKIETSPTYDKGAPYAFSQWLKYQVIEGICDKNLLEKRGQLLFSEDAAVPNYDLFT